MEDRLRCVLNSQAVFFPAFTLVHRAFCAAAFFLRAAAESVRFPRIGTTFAAFRTFAHRARWAAAIRARADLDSLPVPVPFLYVLPNAASAAPMRRSSLVNRSCSFLNRRTTPARLDIKFFFRCRIVSGTLAALGSCVRSVWSEPARHSGRDPLPAISFAADNGVCWAQVPALAFLGAIICFGVVACGYHFLSRILD